MCRHAIVQTDLASLASFIQHQPSSSWQVSHSSRGSADNETASVQAAEVGLEAGEHPSHPAVAEALGFAGGDLTPLRPNAIPNVREWLTAGARHLMRRRGRFYHEVKLCDCSARLPAQVGWLTDQFQAGSYASFAGDSPGVLLGVGDDTHGWAIDGSRHAKWHGGEREDAKWPRDWRTGDVIGCAIDLDASVMQFSLNGEWLPNAQIHFDAMGRAIFPAVSAHGFFRMHIPEDVWHFLPPSDGFLAWASSGMFARPIPVASRYMVLLDLDETLLLRTRREDGSGHHITHFRPHAGDLISYLIDHPFADWGFYTSELWRNCVPMVMAVMERAGLHNVTLDAAESIESGQHQFSFRSGDSTRKAWLFDQSYCNIIKFDDGDAEHAFNIEKILDPTGISEQQVRIVTSSDRRCALVCQTCQVRCPVYNAEAVGSGQDRALLHVKESLASALDSTPGSSAHNILSSFQERAATDVDTICVCRTALHDSSFEERAPTAVDTIFFCTEEVLVRDNSKNALKHPHPLRQTTGNAWTCDACGKYAWHARYRCTAGCDFDLCGSCFSKSQRLMRKKDPEPKAKALRNGFDEDVLPECTALQGGRASPSAPVAEVSGGGSGKAAKRRRRRKAHAAKKTSSDARGAALA